MGGAFLGAGITTGRSDTGAAGLVAAGFSTVGGAAAGFSACLGGVADGADTGFSLAGGC
jgi:hypothetical protein